MDFFKFCVPDADKENTYNVGIKSMKVVGFMDRSQVPVELFSGDGSMTFQSTEGDTVSKHIVANH